MRYNSKSLVTIRDFACMIAFELNSYDTTKMQHLMSDGINDGCWNMWEATLETQKSLDRFLASVERKAFRMAELAVNDSEEALDIVQDSMMALVSRYANKPENEWRPLFYRILQTKIHDWYRRTAVRNRWRVWLGGSENDAVDLVQLQPDTQQLLPEDMLQNAEVHSGILNAIKGLPLRQQQAFLLRAWQGFDVKETAFSMRCSQGSVKTHYSRAVRKLREQLEGGDS